MSSTELSPDHGQNGATPSPALNLGYGYNEEKYPPKWYRWVVTCLNFYVVMCCLGTNFGMWTLIGGLKPFFDQYNEGKQQPDTKWIVYINILMTGLTAVVVNVFFYVTKGSPRIMAMFGAVLATLGVFMSGFAVSVGYLYFSYGILTGIGYGFILTSSLGVLSVYFPVTGTCYTFVNTIVFLGLPMPLLYMRPLTEATASVFGFRPTFFILTCIVGQLVIVAALLRQHELPDSGHVDSSYKERLHDLLCESNVKSKNTCTVEFIISSFLIGMGFNILLLHFRNFTQYNNTSESESETVMVILGSCILLGLAFGLFCHGIAAWKNKTNCDAFKRSRRVLYTISLIAVALVSLLSSIAETYAGHSALAAMVGVFSGVYFPLCLVMMRFYVGNEWKMGTALGIALPLYGLGAFLGLAIGDVLNEEFNNYNCSLFLAGAALMCPVLVIIGGVFGLWNKNNSAVGVTAGDDGLDKRDRNENKAQTPHQD